MSSRGSDVDDSASQRSGASRESASTGTGPGSETSSQRSDSKFLRRERVPEQDEGDLLEQKRTIQDGVFSCMYTLVRQTATGNWKFTILKIVLEGLMSLLVVFNPSITAWRINTGNPVWQVVRWTIWRSPIARLYGYHTYLTVLYIMVAIVLLSVLGLVWLTLAMRKQEQSKWLRKASVVLQVLYEVIFIMFYVSFLDYFLFTANCNFSTSGRKHVHFKGVYCLEMPHLLHMSVALITAAIFFAVTALMVVASSDLNPISTGHLASPAARPRLQILAAKAVYVIAADDLQGWPKPQAVVLVGTVALICWWNFRRLPFYRTSVNIVWCGLWAGVLYVACLLAYLALGKDHTEDERTHVTLLVLYGIFPATAAGGAATVMYAAWARRPARKFLNLTPGVRVQRLHRFSDVTEVEQLSRVMRQYTLDGKVDPDAAALGETIIKAGMTVFPGSPFLLLLYANFLLEVRRDGPAARTQLQLAGRHEPSLLERYQIFCTSEASKRLKDSQEGGMDLQAYVEFRRNFRAVLRVHKEVLLLQAELWGLLGRSTVRVAAVDSAMSELEAAAGRAHQVYRRVLERYPTNGKLLRCFGRFLEDVRHDPVAAARAYGEANRNGGGNALISLDLGVLQGAVHKPEFLTSMSLQDDAVIVINAEGTIMMVSQAVQSVFGYGKTELEGANVALLMPQPFSGRHNSYLQRHAAGGEPHILDSVREVVALHKECYVFPVMLCVTRMSGSGNDSIFLGVARPLTSNSLTMRAWLAPNGTVLCGDQRFASMCGMVERELIGRPFASLVDEEYIEVVEKLLDQCRDAPPEVFAAQELRANMQLRHRYLQPVAVEVTVSLAGTDSQRILVLHLSRYDGGEGALMVVDSGMRLRFASMGLGSLLGYPARVLVGMKLDELMPAPYGALHAKYLRDPPSGTPPPTSCRSGAVVQLLNEAGNPLTVRLRITTTTAPDTSSTLYVVEVERLPPEELLESKRLVLSCSFSGRVLGVSRPHSDLFGFPSWMLVGSSLCDTVDVFQEWRDRAGEGQMQLLMLALLDSEQEIPGASWRVRVSAPSSKAAADSSLPRAHSLAAKALAAKSACLQIELVEDVEEEALAKTPQQGDPTIPAALSALTSSTSELGIRLTLWRRDLLSGVVELDEALNVRKANLATSLILGLPVTVMHKKPFHKFLNLPPGTTWPQLLETHAHHHPRQHRQHKPSALKTSASAQRPVTISPRMTFIGPHPDSGNTRLLLQGVHNLSPGGRPTITATLHPDTTFAAAHANLMRVLRLEGAIPGHPHEPKRRSTGLPAPPPVESNAQGAAASGAGEKGTGATGGLRAAAVMQRQETMTAGDISVAGGVAEVGAAAAAAEGPGKDREGAVDAADGEVEAGKEEKGGEEEAGNAFEDDDDDLSGHRDRHSEDGPRSGDESEYSVGSGQGARGEGGASGEPPEAEADGSQDLEAVEQAKLHRRAASKSDFVAQWVRTISRHRSTPFLPTGATSKPLETPTVDRAPGHQASSAPPPAPARLASVSAAVLRGGCLPADSSLAAAEGPSVSGNKGVPPLEMARSQRRPGAGVARVGSGGFFGGLSRDFSIALGDLWNGLSGRQTSRAITTPLEGGQQQQQEGEGEAVVRKASGEMPAGGGEEGDVRDDGLRQERWEKGSESGDSSAEGSQSGVSFSSGSEAHAAGELVVDARRTKLLRALSRTLLGPVLREPLERLRRHSYGLLAVMLLSHVVAYAITIVTLNAQHRDVALVHRQALAMDRSQLIAVRVMIGAFCQRANVTAKVSVCSSDLNFTLSKLHDNIMLMEQHHHYVYLGDSSNRVVKLIPEVYNVWTTPSYEYHMRLDTAQPTVVSFSAGAWQLGNRYIAAAREALYWLREIGDQYKLHRTYEFLVDNGLGPLFACYARSLDLLVNAAWLDVDYLRTILLVLLVLEPLVIQSACLVYKWLLVARLERCRVMGVLAMLGLPSPVLRQLATQEAKILDDSDDDDRSDVSDGDEEPHELQGPGGTSGGGTGAGGGAVNSGGGGRGGPRGTLASGLPRAARRSDNGIVAAPLKAGASSPVKSAVPVAAPPPAARPVARFTRFLSLKRNTEVKVGEEEVGDSGGVKNSGAASGSLLATGPQSPMERRPGSGHGGKPAGRTSSGGSGSGAGVGSSSGARLRAIRVRGLLVNGKELIPSLASQAKFMVPFLLWSLAVVSVYAVSLVRLGSMQGPLASLNMASHIIYRYTRVRAIAFGFVSSDDTVSRAIWRDMLVTELRYFQSEYDALMYGGTPITQLNAVFTHAVPPSTFESASFANEFFRNKDCFRYDKSECLEPGDPYYEVTHNGLDVMVRRMLAEMNLLSQDDDEDVSYASARYKYMFVVGANDLYEGLQQAAQLFVDFSNARYDEVEQLHTILLSATLAMALLYLFLVLWPHLARTQSGAERQSALLSHVPPELDVRGHVRSVFRKAAAGSRKGGGKAAAVGGSGGSGGGRTGTVVMSLGALMGTGRPTEE